MVRIEPEEQDFDPENFTPQDAAAALRTGIELFNAGSYHAAHEELEKCWLANEGGDADFYKGLIQVAICMHHFARNNAEGARKLYSGFRRLLAPYGEAHRGVALHDLLATMQQTMRAVLRGAADTDFDPQARPLITFDASVNPAD